MKLYYYINGLRQIQDNMTVFVTKQKAELVPPFLFVIDNGNISLVTH